MNAQAVEITPKYKFQPLSGTLLGWLLLGETIGGTFWIGAALIVSGVVLVMKEK